MASLTAQEIKELDHRIDAAVPSQPLLARDRDLALMHLLRFHESYMVGNATTPNRGERENATKHAYDGLHHGVRWVFEYCGSKPGARPLGFKESIYLEAQQLHNAAREYSKVWDLMSMLQRGLIKAHQENDDTIHFAFASKLNKEMDVAGGIINDPYGPELSEPILMPDVVNDIVRSVTVQTVSPQLSYQLSDNLFSRMYDRVSRMTADKWEMDPAWDLGGYTIGQLRILGSTLDTLCVIHGEISRRLGSPTTILGAIIKYHPRSIWERILVKRSRLPELVVANILSDLIYDPTLYGAGKKQPHITYQPIFPFGSNILGVSNWLVHVSNMERNLWDLVSIKRPELHSRLRNLKEDSWIGELRQRTDQLKLKLCSTIKFEFEGQRSDLDALFIDEASNYGLVCQLKWLTQPGRVANVIYNDREIEKGIDQAQLALKWVQSNPRQLSERTGLSADVLARYEFAPVVMCKSTLASGYLRREGVPVINERIFDWVLGDPHRKDLRTLWKVGEELSYLPQEGKHFETMDASVQFAGITFKLDGLACLPKAAWKPNVDMRIPD